MNDVGANIITCTNPISKGKFPFLPFHAFHFSLPFFQRRFEVDASGAGRGAGSFRCCHILGSPPLKGGMSIPSTL